MKESVSLIGMAGVGKSTIGAQLADRLKFNFIDSDSFFEKTTGQSLSDFLTHASQKEFLEIEEKCLISIDLKKTVLATGGSAVLSINAMKYLKNNSRVIFVNAPYEIVYRRFLNRYKNGWSELITGSHKSFRDVYNERVKLSQKYSDNIILNDGDIDSTLKKILKLL